MNDSNMLKHLMIPVKSCLHYSVSYFSKTCCDGQIVNELRFGKSTCYSWLLVIRHYVVQFWCSL